MSKKRESKKLITEVMTAEKAESVLAEYAAADAREAKLMAQMDLEMTRIREKYQEELADLAEVKREAFELLQHYAMGHPELFVGRKSVEMTHGRIGFRTGTPALKTMRGYTWQSCLQLVKEFLPGYVRVKEEVDKEGLLARREDEDVAGKLGRCGLRVEQAETFYVELKKEEGAG